MRIGDYDITEEAAARVWYTVVYHGSINTEG